MAKPQCIVALEDFQRLSGLRQQQYCSVLGRTAQWLWLVRKGQLQDSITSAVIQTIANAGGNSSYWFDASAPILRENMTTEQFKRNMRAAADLVAAKKG